MKAWSREAMKGVCGTLLPTFNSDLAKINERAIRHDVKRTVELGFWGTLISAECGTTPEEYKQVIEIACDEAGDKLHCVVQTSPKSLEETIEFCQAGEKAGAGFVLIGYPAMFRPTCEADVIHWTKSILESTKLGGILYTVSTWDFGALAPSQLSLKAVTELSRIGNCVAIKAEAPTPGTGAITELFRHLRDDLIICDPHEFNSPSWIQGFGMQWMGTSNYEYYGDAVPRYFDLMRKGQWEEAMEIYWRIHPARVARFENAASTALAGMIHRMSWKYQGWLAGFNGGPIRLPTMRLNQRSADALHQGLVRSKVIGADAPGDLATYFKGRNPA